MFAQVWNESFYFNVTDVKGLKLYVNLFDHEVVLKNEKMGNLEIDIGSTMPC